VTCSTTSQISFLCFVGDISTTKLFEKLYNHVNEDCKMVNSYGPAETTIDCTCHFLDRNIDEVHIPIGRPLPNYRCLILDDLLQSVIINQEGELFVGGVGVFAGYLGRDDLIKLHGQRIELGEIEQCLFNTSISACVVIKWNSDHLVAYVQSSSVSEKQLYEHCQSHLPPHMIPSIFIVLDKLPLNANGKVDRKLLPPPHFSSTHLRTYIEHKSPRNEIENKVHHIWCDLFQQKQISIDTNIFSIGGHSLLLMQLFHRYKSEFHVETNTLSIADLFQHPTIVNHARLIHQSINNKQNIDDYPWSSLHITQGTKTFLSLSSSIFIFFPTSKSIIGTRTNLLR
jgi:aryl carrier-like protein